MNSLTPKICYTAAGILLFENKVLLVKHKKLGIWLNPGGHVEDSEMPHQTAEREFFEETGVRVRAVSKNLKALQQQDSDFLPSPILTHLHWVCPENFEKRKLEKGKFKPLQQWPKGCEQHLSFLYLVEPLAGVDFVEDTVETNGIAWFTLAEVKKLPTKENIKVEVSEAFHLVQ